MDMREHPLAQHPEEDNVQGSAQKRTAHYLADERPGQPGMRNLRYDREESQRAKHHTRAAPAPAYLLANGKAAILTFE